jgi:hypothetical protein
MSTANLKNVQKMLKPAGKQKNLPRGRLLKTHFTPVFIG